MTLGMARCLENRTICLWPDAVSTVPSSMRSSCVMAMAIGTSTEYRGHTDKVSPVLDGAHARQRLSTVRDGCFSSLRKGGEETEKASFG